MFRYNDLRYAQMVEPRYSSWRAADDYRIPRVGWQNGELQTIQLDNHWPEWDNKSGELVVANLALSLPAPSTVSDADPPVHQIRALVTDAEAVKTLIKSMDEGNAKLCIVPTLTEGAEHTLSINLAFHCETGDVEGADQFRRLWEGVMQRAAVTLLERIGISIETEIRETV